MTKLFIYTIILISTLLFVGCNRSSSKENNTTQTEPFIDSIVVKKTIESSAELSLQSEIKCPNCEYKKMEKLPTDVCLVSYTCKNCNKILHPKDSDCCVFCTYGSHKCPSKQKD
jgi:PBP1b-binding outer membrane lipoprotein LpoB